MEAAAGQLEGSRQGQREATSIKPEPMSAQPLHISISLPCDSEQLAIQSDTQSGYNFVDMTLSV